MCILTLQSTVSLSALSQSQHFEVSDNSSSSMEGVPIDASFKKCTSISCSTSVTSFTFVCLPSSSGNNKGADLMICSWDHEADDDADDADLCRLGKNKQGVANTLRGGRPSG